MIASESKLLYMYFDEMASFKFIKDILIHILWNWTSKIHFSCSDFFLLDHELFFYLVGLFLIVHFNLLKSFNYMPCLFSKKHFFIGYGPSGQAMSSFQSLMSNCNNYCRMSSAQCPKSKVQCPVTTVQCTASGVRCQVSSVHCPVSSVQFPVSSA